MFTPSSSFRPLALFCGFSPQLLELSVFWVSDPPLFLCPVSEDEVTKDADDIGLARGEHVEDLLRALTGCAGGRGGRQRDGDHEAAYSFSLAPDHRRLSFQKISNGVPVSENWSVRGTPVWCLISSQFIQCMLAKLLISKLILPMIHFNSLITEWHLKWCISLYQFQQMLCLHPTLLPLRGHEWFFLKIDDNSRKPSRTHVLLNSNSKNV